jgi:opacity protein-like surface antigen
MAMRMIRTMRATLLLAMALLTGGASAQWMPVANEGFYLVAAVGRNQYDYDCWFWNDCDQARSTSGKVGFGYRFGVFGVEGWGMDFGRATNNATQESLRLRALAVNGVWYVAFGPRAEGLLRAGVADVTQTRTQDVRNSTFSGTFGLGLVLHVAPALSIELGWDVTGGEGRNSGSTTASALSVGLRARF